MQLNGWQRMWAVIVALWTMLWLWQIPVFIRSMELTAASIVNSFTIWAIPPMALYGAGLTVAWVRRGFERQSAR